ncbi:DUF1441 family protein [Thiorhodovibrio frisius]|uniref:Phage DNA packaging protein, Nu1 subunit of terminase n=1 Tax=Thiorhodovibrio frisius TaxID=631362 RepID=H8YXV1_9GAMM|nr:DUF1441 family protein [Thiorhodovibrio frisius]EIC23277.1 phage DNA packaging protein, Nu1 subunit of terminase [Thiorhodovibrio frisius]WPL23646.1 hypothetical protein Thiofri_03841 [Thiorhodovibrio frisius]
MQVSINQLSEWTGLDRRTVKRRLADLPHKPGPNRAHEYESAVALRLIFGSGNPDGDRLDGQQEKARLDKVRADIAEVELERKRGDLIDVDAVTQTWERLVSVAKGRFMALPTRLSYDLAGLSEPREAERLLKNAIWEVLTELADGDPLPAGE